MAGTNAAVSNRTGTIYYAVADSTTVVEDTADAWAETTTAGATNTTTTANGPTTTDPLSPPKNTTVVRTTCSSVASGAVIMSEAIASTDLSTKSALTFYFRTSVALSAGDLNLLLDSGTVAGDGTDLEVIAMPAITDTNKWHRIVLRLNDPSQDTAIISIGFEFGTGITKDGNFDVYLVRSMAEIEGMMNYSVTYTQENADATDYQSGATREYTKTYKNWTLSFGGHKEAKPPVDLENDYVFAAAESSTVGQILVGDGFTSSFTDNGSFDALVEYQYEVQGTGPLQLPIA